MTSFSDLFSDEYKEEFAKRNLKVGSVIKIHVTDTNPPKEKRLIIVGASYDKVYFASIFINSELNENVFYTDELKDLNLFLEADTRQYLDHDSYADCSEIKKRNAGSLLDLISADPSRILGELSEDDLKKVRARIKTAPTITVSLKKTFGLYL